MFKTNQDLVQQINIQSKFVLWSILITTPIHSHSTILTLYLEKLAFFTLIDEGLLHTNVKMNAC